MPAAERRLPPFICTPVAGAEGAISTDHTLDAVDLDPIVTCDAAVVPRGHSTTKPQYLLGGTAA